MRRADRLFQIVQYLRSRKLTTAEWLAARLEVSKRTVYRDVNDLILSGVPIEGEAGVGYVLRRKLDLPPLMFDRNELTAIELGLRFVYAYTGPPLAAAANTARAKIRHVLPDAGATDAPGSHLYVPRRPAGPEPRLSPLAAAVDERRKVALRYRDGNGQETNRVTWPLGLFFWGDVWAMLSWCELRDDFRTFRLDRMVGFDVLEATFDEMEGRRAIDYFRHLETTHAVPLSDFDPDG